MKLSAPWPYLAFACVLLAAMLCWPAAPDPNVTRVLSQRAGVCQKAKVGDTGKYGTLILCTGLDKIDIAGCPASFKASWIDYVRAWNGLVADRDHALDAAFVKGAVALAMHADPIIAKEVAGSAARDLSGCPKAAEKTGQYWQAVKQEARKAHCQIPEGTPDF